MAARRQLDLARRAPASPVILLLLLAANCAFAGGSQEIATDAERLASAHRALDTGNWEEAAQLAAGPAQQSAEFDLIEALALARLGRFSEAHAALEAGHQKKPGDPRFPTELAGLAYKQKNFPEAKRELRAALKLDPGARYNHEFLGTIYFLEGNLEAALKYWNPIDKPRLGSVSLTPPPRLLDSLLSRSIAFNPPQTLSTDALLATRARLDALRIFPHERIELAPSAQSDSYDATLHLAEKNGFGGSWIAGAVSTFSGLPYSTVYPEFSNARRQALNFTSLVRWDAQKRRFFLNAASPLFHDPSIHLELFVDARNENWNLSQSFFPAGVTLSDLNVRTATAGARLKFVPSGRWTWNAGIEAGNRSFRNVPGQSLPPAAKPFFTGTNSLAVWLGADRLLLRAPERRFTLDGSAEARAGRNFARGLGGFGVFKGSLLARWFPKATGDDYEMRAQIRMAALAGRATLDELFQLGIERDNDLWLRGHRGTIGGRKGAAPLGRRFFLANWELDKNIYNAGFLKVKLGPLLDTGAAADSSGLLGSRRWLVDAGAQCKIQVLGAVTLTLSYGRDLRGGRNVFYPTVVR
jgi:tetratricopeptide (TPR) repeat protein